MSKNTLVSGTPRIGWMIDGDENTPEIAVMLERTDESIQLTIPNKGMFDHNDPYGRWFSSGVEYSDDPDRTRFRYEPPSSLLFNDHLGPVSLIGCRQEAASFGSNGAGFGRVVADYAVLGGRSWINFEKVNGVRTEMPGLAEWTGISSRKSEVKNDKARRALEYIITMRSPAPQSLARNKNLTLQPTWRSSNLSPGTVATHDVIQLETTAKRSESWDGLLAPHRAVQDLLSLSAWKQFGFSRIEVGVHDSRIRQKVSETGEDVGKAWSEVVTHRLRLADDESAHAKFLFTYSDIGAIGVRRWIRLRSKYERALLPLIGIVDERGLFVETRVAQTGIAIEALGFQLANDERNGFKLNARGQISYSDAMDAILADMSVVPIPDIEKWKSRSRLSYMGVKHADNPTPGIVTLANAYRENALVLRYWIAGRLGCAASTLTDRRRNDPLASEWIAE
ncbi:hypothetical protein UQW22_13610 [Isoptericola halotolerans]|uniref:ApeA N-terminal domain 1-containing protein n=1 Tax=Isoptericola halotolerans TaxID=300560 RepID=UPI00388E8321